MIYARISLSKHWIAVSWLPILVLMAVLVTASAAEMDFAQIASPTPVCRKIPAEFVAFAFRLDSALDDETKRASAMSASWAAVRAAIAATPSLAEQWSAPALVQNRKNTSSFSYSSAPSGPAVLTRTCYILARLAPVDDYLIQQAHLLNAINGFAVSKEVTVHLDGPFVGVFDAEKYRHELETDLAAEIKRLQSVFSATGFDLNGLHESVAITFAQDRQLRAYIPYGLSLR